MECGTCGTTGHLPCPHTADLADADGWCTRCEHPMDYGTQPGEKRSHLYTMCPDCQ